MPDSPQEKLRAKYGAGLLFVRGSTYYFCAKARLHSCRMPDEFQEQFPGISAKFFEKVNAPSGGSQPAEEGLIHRELDRLFSQFKVADGIVQAVWLDDGLPPPAGQPTQADFIKSFQGAGLLVSRQGIFYFIPLSMLTSIDFDHGLTDAAKAELDKLLRDCRSIDGIEQAIWIDVKQLLNTKHVSRSSGSRQIVFVYSDDEKKILVDMSKGGKPSSAF